VKKLTPIMTVDAIEPCLGFWTERLGSTVTTQVPHKDRLGFAILARLEGVEVVLPMRKTFYGSEEIFVRAPCGTVVGFAQFGEG